MKLTPLAILVASLLIGGAIIFSAQTSSSGSGSRAVDAHNVSIVDGTQVVAISAKDGYNPQKSLAKAGVPTILRFNTSGSYDCSSSIRIPSLNISQALPASGATDINVGTPRAGVLRGTCGMGMFSFEVDFKS
jgi:plastocyanin domain-containing protein